MKLTIYLKGGDRVVVPCTRDDFASIAPKLIECMSPPASGRNVLDLKSDSSSVRLLADEIAGYQWESNDASETSQAPSSTKLVKRELPDGTPCWDEVKE